MPRLHGGLLRLITLDLAVTAVISFVAVFAYVGYGPSGPLTTIIEEKPPLR